MHACEWDNKLSLAKKDTYNMNADINPLSTTKF